MATEKLNLDNNVSLDGLTKPGSTAATETPAEAGARRRAQAAAAKTAAASSARVREATVGLPAEQASEVQQAAATKGSSAAEELAKKYGNANLAKQVPPWVVQLLGQVPTSDDLEKIRLSYNSMVLGDRDLKDDQDVLAMMASGDQGKIYFATSMAFAGQPQDSIEIDLGTGYSGRKVSVSTQEATALQKQWPDAAPKFNMIAGISSLHDLPRALLASASQAHKLLGSGKHIDPIGQVLGDYELARQLKENIATYGDYTLALVATVDKGIAEKIRAGVNLESDEQQKVRQLLLDGNYSKETMANAGIAIDPLKFDFVAAQAGGGTTTKVTLPNQEEVKQSLETLFRAWFQHAPSEADLNQFAGKVNAAASNAQGGGSADNPFQVTQGGTKVVEDPGTLQSQAIAYARSNPEYGKLFDKKPGNLDETGYVQQMSNAAQRTFGDEGAGAADAIRAGLESGRSQTTVGYLAGSKDAFENSTFMERMANAAETVSRMT